MPRPRRWLRQARRCHAGTCRGPQTRAAARSAVAAASDLAQALNGATRAKQLRAEAGCRHRRLGRSRQHAAGPVRDGQQRDLWGDAPGRRSTDYRPARPDPGPRIAEVGVRTASRGDNDMAVFTDSGVTLFTMSARGAVASTALLQYTPTTSGNASTSMALVQGAASHAAGSGRSTGLVAVRDGWPSPIRNQLWTRSRAADPNSLPRATRARRRRVLSTCPGFSLMPVRRRCRRAAVLTGLAGTIKVSASADPAQAAMRPASATAASPATGCDSYNAAGAGGCAEAGAAAGPASGRWPSDAAGAAAPSGTVAGFGVLLGLVAAGGRKSAEADNEARPRSRTGRRRRSPSPPASTSTRR